MFQEICLGLLVILVAHMISSYLNRPRHMPPGPLVLLPILGNLIEVLRWIREKKLHLELTKYAKIYNGKVFKLQLPGRDIVVINSASTAREALLTKRDDFAGRPSIFTFDYLTYGSKIISASDFHPTMLLQRKIVHSAIRMYNHKLGDTISKEVEHLKERLKAYDGKAIDPLHDLTLTSLNVICAMVLGEHYEIDDPEFLMILDYNQKMFSLLCPLNILNVFPFLVNFPIQESKKIKFVREISHRFLKKKYREHKETYRDGFIRDLTDALIKAMLEAEQENSKTQKILTEEHVFLTMGEAFSAGIETATTTILWLLIWMVRHPAAQTKIQSELDSVVGRDALPVWEDRKKMNYTMAAIEETFRASTPAPLIPHKATKDSTLESYSIPKNTTIFINTWAIHQDEREWDEPHLFKPERFLDKDGKLIQIAGVKSFLPFGAGRRVCVGESLAKQEVFIVVSRLLHMFKVEPEKSCSFPSNTGEFAGLVNSPKPFKIRFVLRT